jgi:NADPH:quinone reductase
MMNTGITHREGTKMRAIVRRQYGGPEELLIQELPIPEPKPEHVVIRVKALGLNHAEIYMRRGNGAMSRR